MEPHPLTRFVLEGALLDLLYADAIVVLLDDFFSDEDSPAHRGATWLFLDSEKAFPAMCELAGLDARKLREHLMLSAVRSEAARKH
jgi:hypothetical protein